MQSPVQLNRYSRVGVGWLTRASSCIHIGNPDRILTAYLTYLLGYIQGIFLHSERVLSHRDLRRDLLTFAAVGGNLSTLDSHLHYVDATTRRASKSGLEDTPTSTSASVLGMFFRSASEMRAAYSSSRGRCASDTPNYHEIEGRPDSVKWLIKNLLPLQS